ncbi:hypothetical protein LEN26_006121 [Aphanomyces euteiches]|uniref:Uncharacterized protein n=1 Tax=Aphanomyces euteiches TaxID=100861 RepID=A0A6G0WPI5_9STRA|nr:hypothetical protein Ae201684_013012 [Aphanomyces euteiches]KAH9076916.1 hypothetical protein Ae201684P_010846 [Aphanomyces euteiches]KAH9110117.1 hypothetical protein AeMF1_014992 [Aphanomyces euteiches]KAH9136549.1 hypothetical protein LEN26_006121 [Aphanomyces euteiches]KAH9139735.1 hypothetical protein AeRB84_015997 [Aphanomyces euteiches]
MTASCVQVDEPALLQLVQSGSNAMLVQWLDNQPTAHAIECVVRLVIETGCLTRLVLCVERVLGRVAQPHEPSPAMSSWSPLCRWIQWAIHGNQLQLAIYLQHELVHRQEATSSHVVAAKQQPTHRETINNVARALLDRVDDTFATIL